MGATIARDVRPQVTTRIAVGELVYEHHPDGGLLRRATPDPSLFTARDQPPGDLPPRSEIFGREELLETVREAWTLGDSVVLQARPGGGTTSVLRLLAHGPAAAEFPDGVVYLDGAGWRADDLLQRIAEAFHRCDRTGLGLVLRPDEVLRVLEHRRALVIVDHADLAPAQLERICDALPSGVMVLGTSVALDGPIGTTLGLPGLDTDAGIELLAREFARPLNAVQRTDAETLISALGGRPLALVQAAGRVRMERAGLHEPAPHAEHIVRDLLDPDGGRSTTQVVAATLAAFWPTRLNRDALGALLADPHDLDPAVAHLLDLGLATGSDPVGYTVDPALIDRVAARFDLPSVRTVAADRLGAWAADHADATEAVADVGPAAAQAAVWALDAGRSNDVVVLARAFDGPLSSTRRWQLWGELLGHALHACAQARLDPADEAWAHHQAGTRSLAIGDERVGRELLTRAAALRQSLGDEQGAARAAANLAALDGDRNRTALALAAAASLGIAALLAVLMFVRGDGDGDDVPTAEALATASAEPGASPAASADPPVSTTPPPVETAAPTTATPVVAPPPSPSGVTATADATAGVVVVSWEPSQGATGYEILRDGNTVEALASDAVRWIDDGAVAGQTHEYSVIAVGPESTRSLPSPGVRTTLTPADTRGPTTPGSVSATFDGGAVVVGWSAAADRGGVESYVVRRDGVEIATVGAGTLSFTDPSPVEGATHRYDVIAVDTSGNRSRTSAAAEVVVAAPDTTPPSTPGPLGLGQQLVPDPPAIVVTWGASTDDTGVVEYRVLRSGSPAATVSGDATILADPDWRSGRYGGDADGCGPTSVDYAVEAVDAAGNVSGRTSFTVTVPPSC